VNAPEVFSDATVAIGASYDYYVTSVDSSGNESVPSNTATLNIP
jgi:fibronectin type 3 domain-containing protein